MGRISEQEYVLFDVETTGLAANNGDRVIEIAALKIKNLHPVDEFSSLVNPERPISYGAFLVNGISQEMLVDAPRACYVFPQFMSFVGTTPLVGHNVSFDLGFLRAELNRLGAIFSDEIAVLDTLRMARGLVPGLGSYSLQPLAYTLGIDVLQQHRAMADVALTHKVFCHLLDLAEAREIPDLESLCGLFGTPSCRQNQPCKDYHQMIEAAITKKNDLQMTYYSPYQSSTTKRRITPQKIIKENGTDVVIGFCHLRGEQRGFKIERILHMQTV